MLQFLSMKVAKVAKLPKVDPYAAWSFPLQASLNKTMRVDGDVNTRFKV
jgi:hypothetical protein